MPKFQITFILVNWFFLSLLAYSSYYTVSDSFSLLRSIGERMRLSNSSGYMKFIASQELFILQNMIISVGLAFIVSMLVTLVLSHKVAGPVYRVKKYFEELDPDNPEAIKFRQGDFFEDLPEVINQKVARRKDS